MRTAVRVRQRYLIPLLAAAATAVGIAAAPPAAADCVEGGGVVLCAQGESRVSNRTPLPATTPYIPYPCDVDWMCDQGLGIAFGD
jgi:hypothetical protein